MYSHLTRPSVVQTIRISCVHEISTIFSDSLSTRGQRCKRYKCNGLIKFGDIAVSYKRCVILQNV